MEARHVDNLLVAMGNPGRFQVLTFLLLGGCYVLNVCNSIAPVFYLAKTRHHCKVDNISLVPAVIKNNEKKQDSCTVYLAFNTSKTIPCRNGWDYHLEEGESTIISEFDLVCDNAYKGDLSTSIYFFGMILGGPCFGYFGDRFGRRSVVAFVLFTSSIIGGVIFAFRSYIVYTASRFVLGCLLQGLANSINVLVVELFPTKYRVYAVFFLMAFELCVILVFDFFAYLMKDWKYIQLMLAVVTFTQLFSIRFVPESLRWYLTHKKLDQAELLVKRVVEFNGLPFPHGIFNSIKQNFSESKETTNSQGHRKANILDVIKEPKLRRTTLIISLIWFTCDMSYFVLAFSLSSLHGNKYLNVAISCLMDLSAVLIFIWLLPRVGRRKPVFSVLLCSCAIFGGNAVIASIPSDEVLAWFRTVLVILGKMLSLCCFGLVIILTSEVYPTVVRNVSLGVNGLSARVGAMLAPQMLLLGAYTTTSVPYSILSVLALTGGLLTWLLPETHNAPLSDKLDCTEILYPAAVEKNSSTVNEKILAYETSI